VLLWNGHRGGGREGSNVRRHGWIALTVSSALVVSACAGGDDEAARLSNDADPQASAHEAPSVEEQRPGFTVVAYDVLIPAAVDNIQAFWASEFEAVYGQPYEPIPDSSLHPYDEDNLPPPCGGYEFTYEEMADNAFWCTVEGFMAWDDQGLFPELYTDYGPFAVAMVLAHEWGHAIQDQIDYEDVTITMEQQADCFAGAWTAHALETEDEVLGLRVADLEIALGGMLRFRDAPGTSAADPHAHGSGFDRINAFQEGYELGAVRCAEYPTNPPRVVDLPFLSDEDFESGGNLDYDTAIELAGTDLNEFWRSINRSFEPITTYIPYDPRTERVPMCEGVRMTEDEGTYIIRFCFQENTIIWDDNMLRTVHRNIGDFGAATLLGTTWAEAAQKQLGSGEAFIRSRQGLLQQACFTGAWAGGSVTSDVEEKLLLSPGDLDEAVQAFLSFSQTPDELGRTSTGSAFERSQAFRVGFFDGAESCDAFAA